MIIKKWEYCSRRYTSNTLISIDHLNELGNNGWELINIILLSSVNIYYFKKEKIEKLDPIGMD